MSIELYKDEYMDTVPELIAATGANNQQIADKLGVSISTFKGWFIRYPDFYQRIVQARDMYWSEHIEQAMVRRAIGYDYTERETGSRDGKEVDITRTKHLPPDPAAGKEYLTKRDPERWKGKEDDSISSTREIFAMILDRSRGLPAAPVELNNKENQEDAGG